MTIKFRPRVLVWLLGLTVLVGTAAGSSWFLNHSEAVDHHEQAPKKTSAPIATADGIVCFGYADVEPGIASLYPVQPGRVVWVESESKQVHKGDVLLRLDDRLAKLRVQEAQADLNDSRAQLAQAEQLPAQHKTKVEQQRAAIDAAQRAKEAAAEQLAIKEKLFNDQQINVHELHVYQQLVKKADALIRAEEGKQKELEAVQPQTSIDRAKAEVAAKQARLEQAKLAVEECELLAPSDGELLRVLANVGEVLSSTPKGPAIQFCPKGERIIRAEVLQEWASRVQVGQEAVIEDDTSNVLVWQGKVTRLSDWYTQRRSVVQEPFQYNDVRTLECLVRLTGPEGQPLRIGQRVRVMIRQGGP